MVFNTVGSIATHIASKMVLPEGVSGALVDTVDLQRIKVSNFISQTIPSNDIAEAYQDIITDFSKADVLEESFMWASTIATSGGASLMDSTTASAGGIKLGDLDIKDSGKVQTMVLNYLSTLSKETPIILRKMAQSSMDNLPLKLNHFKALG